MLNQLAITALCCTSVLFASQQEAKHYCSPSEIEIYESMILVHVEDEIFETDSLLSDQGGVYFLANRLRCPECHKPLNPKNTCEYHPTSRS